MKTVTYNGQEWSVDPKTGWIAPVATEEQPKAKREMCPAYNILRDFVLMMDNAADWGHAGEIVTAPWCGSDGVWRAEVRASGKVHRLCYGVDGWESDR